ncbi:hypothetical protein D3C72_971300 [compost metagenome]
MTGEECSGRATDKEGATPHGVMCGADVLQRPTGENFPHIPPESKTAPEAPLFLTCRSIVAPWRSGSGTIVYALAERTGCYVTDVVTGQADVAQSLVGQAAKFVDRAAVGDPVLCDADGVHGRFLNLSLLISSAGSVFLCALGC